MRCLLSMACVFTHETAKKIYVADESRGEVMGKRDCGKGQTVAPIKCSALTLTTLYDAENTTEMWREKSMLSIFLYILLFFTYSHIIMRFVI